MDEDEEMKSKRFREELTKYYNLQGKESFKYPIVSGKNLDLYKLYKEVIKRGGYQVVYDNKQWKDVVLTLDLPPSCTSASFTVKRHYKKYLLSYEQTFNKTSLDAKVSDKLEDGQIKKFDNFMGDYNIANMNNNLLNKNQNINNINIQQKQIIGQPSNLQEKNYLGKKIIRNDPVLDFFFRNPTGGYIGIKDKSSINKTIRILSAIPDMKRIELAFESHITSEIYWAINVLLIFSSNTNKDINIENQPFLMESITNYIYYCVNNISELSFIIDVLQGKRAEQHELLKAKIKLNHSNLNEHNNNGENLTRNSSTTSLINKDKKFGSNNSLNNNNDKFLNPSLSKLRNKGYQNNNNNLNTNNFNNMTNNVYNLKPNISTIISTHRNLSSNNKGDFKFLDESNHIISLPCLTNKNIDLKEIDEAKSKLLINEDDENEYSNENKYEEITEYELYENLLSLIQIIRNLSFTVSNEALISKSNKLMNIIFLLFIHSNINDLLLNTLDIITNLSKNIFLNKSQFSSMLLYKLFKCLVSPYRELSEQSLECFRKLTLPNGNDVYFELMPNEFMNEIVNLLISPKNNTRDSALEILYCLSDQSLSTKTRLSKIENCIPRLVALICSYDNRISKFAACVLSKLAEVPSILKLIMPYEQELFVAASIDDSITKVLLGIISN
jgi:hypothetical protein